MKAEGNISTDTFEVGFGAMPEWRVRAPGRVNLIGDHTDYNNLPVFPMAIQRSVKILGRTRSDGRIRVKNMDPTFEDLDFEISPDVIRGPVGSWENYVKAAPRALAKEHDLTYGFDAIVSSDIPVAAGLSSSSALVVACGLATCYANSLSLPPMIMADLMAHAERFVGTEGGGMDQAVCLGGQRGAAVRIDFAPLRLETVDVPDDWRFVVAHSLVRAEKSGAMQDEYNSRTSDCKLALERVARALDQANEGFPRLLAKHGPENVLGVAEHELSGSLLRRFRHTVSEAMRVDRAVNAMRCNDRVAFGELMIASHASLKDDYEVSVPALDELVEVMMDAGCDGARLTGAGFGGCVVGVCTTEVMQQVRDVVADTFYAPRATTQPLEELFFSAEPSAGAECSPVP